MISSLVLGLVFLLPGLALRYWINRRKFYRRGPMGAEGFSSYESSWIITLVERVGKWVAYALIILGVGMLWVYWRERKEKEKITQKEVVEQQRTKQQVLDKNNIHF
ncbi:hypothetical protein SAMN04488128_103780 [Chitinophaga eiseniae]|uniref:Molybdenum ABC transporter permease n=1 Tax=Chitinophaga eiseniae TaxID=634771 RepID=A0A1T4SY79_9BACT|nr:molybdenum ABC transporter permease [Chitinophaga eiseniae]SKA33157.1 hypothetical protein SAMN04488128_103780 [Chitinophaga eiseniae]